MARNWAYSPLAFIQQNRQIMINRKDVVIIPPLSVFIGPPKSSQENSAVMYKTIL